MIKESKYDLQTAEYVRIVTEYIHNKELVISDLKKLNFKYNTVYFNARHRKITDKLSGFGEQFFKLSVSQFTRFGNSNDIDYEELYEYIYNSYVNRALSFYQDSEGFFYNILDGDALFMMTSLYNLIQDSKKFDDRLSRSSFKQNFKYNKKIQDFVNFSLREEVEKVKLMPEFEEGIKLRNFNTSREITHIVEMISDLYEFMKIDRSLYIELYKINKRAFIDAAKGKEFISEIKDIFFDEYSNDNYVSLGEHARFLDLRALKSITINFGSLETNEINKSIKKIYIKSGFTVGNFNRTIKKDQKVLFFIDDQIEDTELMKVIKWANGNPINLISKSEFPEEAFEYHNYKKKYQR